MEPCTKRTRCSEVKVEDEEEKEEGKEEEEEGETGPPKRTLSELSEYFYEQLLEQLTLREWLQFVSAEKGLWLLNAKCIRRLRYIFAITDPAQNNASGGRALIVAIDRVGWRARHEKLSAVFFNEKGIITLWEVNKMAGYAVSNHIFITLHEEKLQEMHDWLFAVWPVRGENLLRYFRTQFDIKLNKGADENEVTLGDEEGDVPRLDTVTKRFAESVQLVERMEKNRMAVEKELK